MIAISTVKRASMTGTASRTEAGAASASDAARITAIPDDNCAAGLRISNIGGGEAGLFKQVSMIVAAAACAGFLVMLIPGFASQVAARTSQPIEDAVTGAAAATGQAELARPTAIEIRKSAEPNLPNAEHEVCAQNWPYYEPSCLHDSRQVDGRARTVRMIALDRQ